MRKCISCTALVLGRDVPAGVAEARFAHCTVPKSCDKLTLGKRARQSVSRQQSLEQPPHIGKRVLPFMYMHWVEGEPNKFSGSLGFGIPDVDV